MRRAPFPALLATARDIDADLRLAHGQTIRPVAGA